MSIQVWEGDGVEPNSGLFVIEMTFADSSLGWTILNAHKTNFGITNCFGDASQMSFETARSIHCKIGDRICHSTATEVWRGIKTVFIKPVKS